MNLLEMKKKVLRLIEEISDNETNLTDDPDIKEKMNDVTNQVMFEVARMKKIPDYVEIEVTEGEVIKFEDISSKSGYEVYQIDVIRGIDYEMKAQGTIVKALEDGTLEIEYFKYPKRITDDTVDANYVFELSDDALEVMPYGIAADLLKSDISNNYGQIYSQRYETMLQRLDPRYSMGSIYIEGGIEI